MTFNVFGMTKLSQSGIRTRDAHGIVLSSFFGNFGWNWKYFIRSHRTKLTRMKKKKNEQAFPFASDLRVELMDFSSGSQLSKFCIGNCLSVYFLMQMLPVNIHCITKLATIAFSAKLLLNRQL